MKRHALLWTPLLACAALGARAADPAAPIQLHLSVQERSVTRDAGGRERTAWAPLPASGVRPGDVLRYTLAGENHGPRPVAGLILTQPVPAGMTFVLGSAAGDGARVTYSVDGGRTFDAAPTVRVAAPGGGTRPAPAPAAAYTQVRWALAGAVAPGAAAHVACEVRVD